MLQRKLLKWDLIVNFFPIQEENIPHYLIQISIADIKYNQMLL